jgi:hypothetical protein
MKKTGLYNLHTWTLLLTHKGEEVGLIKLYGEKLVCGWQTQKHLDYYQSQHTYPPHILASASYLFNQNEINKIIQQTEKHSIDLYGVLPLEPTIKPIPTTKTSDGYAISIKIVWNKPAQQEPEQTTFQKIIKKLINK